MALYTELTREQLKAEYALLSDEYHRAKGLGLSLNMARGKPAEDQLDLAEPMLSCIASSEDCIAGETDTRNYGLLEGIPEARKLFGDILGAPAEQVLVGGNSDLNMIYDTFVRAMLFGLHKGCTPWSLQEGRKFLCPSPGYDRHFAIAEQMGFELVTVPMLTTGPDMSAVEKLVSDPLVKGIFCVPKYSNPTGITFSDETVRRLARLHPAADDFLIVWDNAYVVHDLYDEGDVLLNLLDECRAQGTEDMVFTYTSTSKITYPGAGVAAMATSPANLEWHKSLLGIQSIGPNKLNQLRHVRFLKDMNGVRACMKRHAELLRPKFEIVLDELDRSVKSTGTGAYVRPRGGYFISLDVWDGCAARTLSLLSDLGVHMTPAGSTYPHHKDPRDANIRIAPTFAPLEELGKTAELLGLCVRMAALEKLLSK